MLSESCVPALRLAGSSLTVEGWTISPNFRSLITRHARAGMMVEALPGVAVVASNATTEPIHHVYEPALGVLAQGTKRTVLNDKIFEYRAGQYLVVAVDLPITGHVVQASASEPFLAMGLVLKPANIATLLLETATSDRAVVEPLGLGISNASPELLDPVVRLLRLLDRPEDIAVLAPMIEREILWRLLAGRKGAVVRQIGLWRTAGYRKSAMLSAGSAATMPRRSRPKN